MFSINSVKLELFCVGLIILFIVLSPGLLLNIPPVDMEWGDEDSWLNTKENTVPSSVVHGTIFAGIVYFILKSGILNISSDSAPVDSGTGAAPLASQLAAPLAAPLAPPVATSLAPLAPPVAPIIGGNIELSFKQ